MSWNSSSVSCGPEWQSVQAAFPTNSRAPRWAAAEIRVEPVPSATNSSNGESTLISWYSKAAIAFAQFTSTPVAIVF